MDPREQLEMLLELAEGRAVLLRAASGVSEEDARRAPAEGRWSVLECVEHCVLVEEYLRTRLQSATDSSEAVVNAKREARIREIAPTRQRRISAPDAAVPTGRFASLAEAVRMFDQSRETTIRFIAECQDDLRAKLTTHPILGPVNGYETLLMIAAHPRRHAGQIEEIKSTLTAD